MSDSKRSKQESEEYLMDAEEAEARSTGGLEGAAVVTQEINRVLTAEAMTGASPRVQSSAARGVQYTIGETANTGVYLRAPVHPRLSPAARKFGGK